MGQDREREERKKEANTDLDKAKEQIRGRNETREEELRENEKEAKWEKGLCDSKISEKKRSENGE